MADFFAATCTTANTQSRFKTYTDPGCDRIRSEIMGIAFLIEGGDLECITDLTDLQAADASGELVYFKAIGTKNDATPNTITDPFPCSSDNIVQDYTESLDFSTPYHPDNYEFWNNIRGGAPIGTMYYVVEGGLIHKIPATPTLTITKADEAGIEAIKGSVEWNTNEIEQPFRAHKTFFGC